jgi:hypothetical protein
MGKQLITDPEIEFIERQIQEMESFDYESAIIELINRVREAYKIILFYSTPGNVIGNYNNYNERATGDPVVLTQIGAVAKNYFKKCSKNGY